MRPLLLQVLFALLAVAAPVAAQQSTHLSGAIRDPSGAGVPDAAITVIHEDTGFRRIAASRSDGGYVVASLQPGLYKITVRKEGFRTMVRFGVKLDVAQPTRVDFSLLIGSMQEAITVEDSPAGVGSEQASMGTLVGRDQIDRLPLNGRGLLSLLELAPGAIVTPATRGEAGQFTTNGQRPNTHYFTVDGASVNTGVSGGGLPAQCTGGSLPGMTAIGSLTGLISMEALGEFLIQTSSAAPEFGRMPGAQISLSSRSGSNEFHGSVLYYFRHDLLDANDWFANRIGEGRATLRVHDFGAALGGPVKRNRTFFFLTYEGMRLRQPVAWRQAVPNAALRQDLEGWIKPVVDLFPLPNGPALSRDTAEWTGRNNRPAGLDVGSARLDHALTSRLTLFGRYNHVPSASEFGSSQVSELSIDSRSVTFGSNWRMKPGAILDLRLNYTRANAESSWRTAGQTGLAPCPLQAVADYFFPGQSACDDLFRFSVAEVGQVVSGPEGVRRQDQWQILPAAYLIFGAHQVRLGADLRQLSPSRADHGSSLNIIGESVSDFVLRRSLWIASSTPQVRKSVLDEVSLFAQDTWRISRLLTGTFGLRWEFAGAPKLPPGSPVSPFRRDIPPGERTTWQSSTRNFAPRFGVAFRPGAESRTVVRMGAGLYYDTSVSIATDLVNGGPLGMTQYSSAIHAPFPSLLYFDFDPDLRLPLVMHWNVTLERAFTGNDTASLAYAGSSGRYLFRRELGGPGNDELNRLVFTTNNGASRYNGLQAQYRRRMARGWQALLSYSWSHSIDNSSSDALLNWAGPGWEAWHDRGSSDFDVRHVFTGAISYAAPARLAAGLPGRLLSAWNLDGIVRARSGFPITVLNSEYSLGLSFANAFRPDVVAGQPFWIADATTPGGRRLNGAAFRPTTGLVQGSLGRNAINGFGMFQVDLALRREIRLTDRQSLQFRVEAFNLLNQANFADPVRTLANSLFGQSPSMLNLMLGTGSPGSGLAPLFQTGGARSIQIVLRYRF